MDAVLLALGASRRRDILDLVRRRERSAGDIHRALADVSFGAVSQHLGVLERAGLVSARREGRSRLYRARPEGLGPLRQWIDSMWEEALAALKAHAEAEERGRTTSDGPSAAGAWRPRGGGHDRRRRER